MPKIIIKSGYLESFSHFENILDYAGNKIDKQLVHFIDGSVVEFDNKIINFANLNESDIERIDIFTKDGETFATSLSNYKKKIKSSKQNITVQALQTTSEEIKREMKDMDFNAYIGYIEGRKGVEKSNGMGLFDLHGDITIYEAQKIGVEHKDSIFWSHIISLPEDDNRGYTNREAWADFIRSIAPDIAKTYNISLENLVMNGAYHANTDNPHVHLIFYSTDKTEGFIKGGTKALTKATEKLKSKFVNGIYGDDVDEIKALLGVSKVSMRNDLIKLSQPNIEQATKEKIIMLNQELKLIKGKLQYGYLPKETKNVVNEILKELVETNLSSNFEKYLSAQSKYISMYIDDADVASERLDEIKNSFFAPPKGQSTTYHNIIIDIAKNLNLILEQFEQATKEKKSISEYELENALTENLEETHKKVCFSKHEDEIQDFNKLVYSKIIKEIYAKKRNKELYDLITQKCDVKEIFQKIYVSDDEIKESYVNLVNNLNATYQNIAGDDTAFPMESELLNSSYRGVYANINYIESNIDNVIKHRNTIAIQSATTDAIYLLAIALDEETEDYDNELSQHQGKKKSKRLKKKSKDRSVGYE